LKVDRPLGKRKIKKKRYKSRKVSRPREIIIPRYIYVISVPQYVREISRINAIAQRKDFNLDFNS